MREPVMKGSGFYNAHSELQAASSAASDVILNRALQAVLVPRDRPLTLADFGCSQGHNSMRPLGRAIDVLRSRSAPSREVTVFHTDLPKKWFQVAVHAARDGGRHYERLHPATLLRCNNGVWTTLHSV
jgi:hypothetical protein